MGRLRKRISEARKGQVFGSAIGKKVEVLDLETNEIKIYDSGRSAAKDLDVYPTTVFRAIKNRKHMKKKMKYKICRVNIYFYYNKGIDNLKLLKRYINYCVKGH